MISVYLCLKKKKKSCFAAKLFVYEWKQWFKPKPVIKLMLDTCVKELPWNMRMSGYKARQAREHCKRSGKYSYIRRSYKTQSLFLQDFALVQVGDYKNENDLTGQ